MSGVSELLCAPRGVLDLFNNTKYSDGVVRYFYASHSDRSSFAEKSVDHVCHKAILSSKSTWFNEQLARNSSEDERIVEVHRVGISPEVFADFLKILYGWEFGPTALQKPEIQFMHRVILIHSAAVQLQSSLTQSACRTAFKTMLHGRSQFSDKIEEVWRDELADLVNTIYSSRGAAKTKIGRVMCQFLAEKHPTFLKSSEMEEMLQKYPDFVRGAFTAAVDRLSGL